MRNTTAACLQDLTLIGAFVGERECLHLHVDGARHRAKAKKAKNRKLNEIILRKNKYPHVRICAISFKWSGEPL